MWLLDQFGNPATRPRAIIMAIGLGAAVAAYIYWAKMSDPEQDTKDAINKIQKTGEKAANSTKSIVQKLERDAKEAGEVIAEKTVHAAETVKAKVAHVADKVQEKAQDAADQTEKVVRSVYKKISEKIPPAKQRVENFRNAHLERFFKVKQAGLKENDKPVLTY